MPLKYLDLLAVPFLLGSDDPARGGLDCWGQARALHARAGRSFPDLSRTIPEESHIDLGPFEPAPTLAPLTLLLSDPDGHGYPSHVSTVVRPGYALSTSRRHGAYCWPIGRIPQELGAWRVRAAHGGSR